MNGRLKSKYLNISLHQIIYYAFFVFRPPFVARLSLIKCSGRGLLYGISSTTYAIGKVYERIFELYSLHFGKLGGFLIAVDSVKLVIEP